MDQYEASRSPEGYDEKGVPFDTDRRGRHQPMLRHPRNMARAGQYTPNRRECNRQKRRFDREDFEDMYGNCSPHHHPQSPYAGYGSSSSPEDRFANHPSQREEYRDPSRAPHYREKIYNTEWDMKVNYLGGRQGVLALQPSEIQRLGFFNPQKSEQVLILMHHRLVSSWESHGRYEGSTYGPDITKILACPAFPTLNSRKQQDVIHWYNNLSSIAIGYRIAICPFQHIELAYGSVGLCIPGVGIDRYKHMGREQHTLLASKLLPMQNNADNSKLAEALALATDASIPNGYDLLFVLLKELVPAFDHEKVEISWPQFSEYESIPAFATAVEQTIILASKRQQPVSPKNGVLQFLNGVINEANHDYRLQSQIIKTELNPYPPVGEIPPRFDLKKLAFEITNSKPKDAEDKDLQMKPSIYRCATQTASTGTSTDTPTHQMDLDSTQIQSIRDLIHMQGFHEERYKICAAIYHPKDGRRRRGNYPVPDPAKHVKRGPSLYDATIVCDACGQRGHPAVRCFALAAAIYIPKFIAKKSNDETAQKAVEFWKVRNAPILRDASTKEPLAKNPMQILRTYMDHSGMDLEQLVDEVDWYYFDEDGSESEVFGIGGRAERGLSLNDSLAPSIPIILIIRN
jgi:hypothetical protein